MTDVLLWLGPVSTDIVKPALPIGWEVKTYNRGVDGKTGSDAFRAWAQSLGADPLARLAPNASRVVMAGFSAAHGAIDVILQRAASDSRIVGLLALDAYYVAWKVTTPKQGYLQWLSRAIDEGLPAWLTTSTHHPPQHPSATESITPLMSHFDLKEAEVPAALKPNENAEQPLPTPNARGRGTVVWLNYTDKLSHVDHARRLARPALAGGPFFGVAARAPAPAQAAAPQNIAKAPPAPTPPPASAPSNNGGAIAAAMLGLGFLGYLWTRPRR